MGMGKISIRVGVQSYKKLTVEEERAGEKWSECCHTGFYCDHAIYNFSFPYNEN